MNILQDALEQALAKALAERVLAEDDIGRITSKAVEHALPGIASAVLEALKRGAPEMLRQHRKLDAGFQWRNHKRWGPALDLLEMMWVISFEVGAEFNARHRPEAVETSDYQFDALTHIHARALLVVREVMCLLSGGYADGALSRWRTLHELAVTALFLNKHDAEVSHRYLASFHFHALRAAEQLNEWAEEAGLDPLSDEEITQMKRRCTALEAAFGEEMRREYGWAAPAVGRRVPKFAHLEDAVDLGHRRPRYRWASQHTHSGHHPASSMLGTAESVEEVLLVGQSNSGFVDPIHMTALSLTLATSALLSTKPSFDDLLIIKILSNLTAEIGPLAIELERRTLQDARSPALRSRD